MRTSVVLSIVTVLILALSLVCFNAYGQSQVKFVKIASSAAGGMWYTTGAMIGDQVSKKIPGVQGQVIVGGSTRNIALVDTNEAQVGFSFPGLASDAYYGKGRYEGKRKTNLRYLGGTTSGPFWFCCRKDLPVTNVTQFIDKRFAMGQKGWASTAMIMAILESIGITEEKVKKAGGVIHYVGSANIPTMMQDGHLDCVIYTAAPPSPMFLAIGENPGIRYIELTDEQIDKALKHPALAQCFKDVVPKGTYREITDDYTVISKMECLMCNANLPADLVYQMTKIIYESDALKDLLKNWKDAFNPRMAMKGNTMPIHEGAKRYYKEKNIPIEEGRP